VGQTEGPAALAWCSSEFKEEGKNTCRIEKQAVEVHIWFHGRWYWVQQMNSTAKHGQRGQVDSSKIFF